MDPFTLEQVVGMVRHPGRPWVERGDTEALKDGDFRRIGLNYLKALQEAVDIPAHQWIHPEVFAQLADGRPKKPCSFSWLPITWERAPSDAADRLERKPLSSFWVDREEVSPEAKNAMPRLLVLLAGSVVSKHQLQTGSDMGLRIILHVHADHVRIYGVTLSGLTTRRPLDVIPDRLDGDADIYGLVERVRQEVGDALDCGKSVWIGNLEYVLPAGVEAADMNAVRRARLMATGFALRWRQSRAQARALARAKAQGRGADQGESDSPMRARTYDFRVELELDREMKQVRVVQVHRDFYINSGAAGTTSSKRVRAFVQDAASKGSAGTLSERRSTLRDVDLDPYRDDILARLPSDEALRFSEVGSGALFEMRGATRENSLLGGSTVARNKAGIVQLTPPQPQTGLLPAQASGAAYSKTNSQSRRGVPIEPDPELRSDAQGAVDAHLRGAELFARMLAYGIEPRSYFRFAKLPLVQRVRPEMRWAPDGELPNAEVRPFMGDAEASLVSRLPQPKPRDPLQLLVKYGSADPVHRRKLPFVPSANGHGRADGRLKSQYLSVACDPRWAWHEFGHVLAFASTGELEFPFAHSAGDGLAAIAADPISRLATARDPEAEVRHLTFPWIEVPGRSHGRSAVRGYGWCGCRNLTRLDFTASLERYHHNYFGEQILSSSLFRLYRSLGGDTRALADDPKDDVATLPEPNPQDEEIRLSASDYCIYLIMRGISLLGPDSLAPGRTPDQFVSALIEADLGTGAWNVTATWPFNRDQRRMKRHGGRVHKVIRWAFEQQGLYATNDPTATSDEMGAPPSVDVFIADRGRQDGGYAPMPLRPDGSNWHAEPASLRRDGHKLIVKVQNRGDQPAEQTQLRAWWASATAPKASKEAVKAGLKWISVKSSVAPCNIGGRDSATLALELPDTVSGPGWVFVSVDAPADPSNLPGGVRPPSSWPELLELVAHDNNLALTRV
ncbi:hypothetical protein [Roseateles saccharophilus]|uniref:hypothetical protein n=1 Tax=Roseateles saccharophilus TaxID=304 RepID=UPI00286BB01C|nr:hypothetical protein [Roseateles saccharophilus]